MKNTAISGYWTEKLQKILIGVYLQLMNLTLCLRRTAVLATWLIVVTNQGAFAQSSGVLREVYLGISGTAVSDLTNSPNFPDNPSLVEVLDTFEAPSGVGESYGQRMRAYLVPPTTGDYTFWIASDDNSTLYLSTDDSPANKQAIASVSTWANSRQWTKYPEQRSEAIRLIGGTKYYFEALMKQGSGGDNLAVRWQLPNGVIEEPIPGARLQVFGLTAPEITQQPTNVSALEGESATFEVRVLRQYGVVYQWQRAGLDIPGATNSTYTLGPLSIADNGAQFRCTITNSEGHTNSNVATLNVLADTVPPTIVSVGNLGDPTQLSVLFSKPIELLSGTDPGNYTIDNGVAVNAASFSGDSRSVVLRTTPMSQGVTYTLTVNRVRDRALIPNTIAPNTRRTFALDYTPLDISNLNLSREPLGPSSRRTGLVISEVMYHPVSRVDGKLLEFIELYNSQVFAEDISGFQLTGEINYTFPTNTWLPAGGYMVVAPAPADVESVYGISGVRGGFTNRLSGSSGIIQLRHRLGAILLEAHYSSDPPWPVAADGSGHSLVLTRPSYGESNPEAWEASDLIGGTPGRGETPAANPYRTVVINEVLAHTDEPEMDFVELFNYSDQPVDLTGCSLSDHPATNRFKLPSITIGARGFVVFNQLEMGFALSAEGETVYFKNSDGKVIDCMRFKGQENGVTTGRYPDGAPGFSRLTTKTPNASNSRNRVSDVVINEIMYRPLSGGSEDEFIELFNRGTSTVQLAGWKLSGGVSFTFPASAQIAAGGYLVVASKAAHLMTNYTGLNAANTLGDFDGKLGNGDRVSLTAPDESTSTNAGQVVTKAIDITMDEVEFVNGGRWGKWADGGGSSLELVDAHSDHRLAPNWGDSDENNKSDWTTIEYTGTLDNGNGAADSLQIFLQGAGECLVDDVEVIPVGGANLVANPDFESSFATWFPQGTHAPSYWQSTGGNGGGKCLHVVATGRGDTGANRIRTPLKTALSSGMTVTLRAKVRWLKGNPEILLRLHGNWLEAYGNIAKARNLGTPGAPNSRALPNAGPAIHHVSHSPVLPAAGQPVTVRAQVSDPDGLGSLALKYRVDPATNFVTIGMTYNGAGLYSATIPGQAANSMVAFYIQAADNAVSPVTSAFPNDAPSRECLVHFGEPLSNPGRIGTYRFWISQATNNRWIRREKNSNEPLDATFVYGDNRVVYNIGTLYSGSPWHTPEYNGPLNSICDYILSFPEDDPMLGTKDFILASLGNLNNDDTAQREQTAFWMLGEMGLPTMYRRHVNLFVNGLRRGLLYEDAQQPSGEVVDEWFADDNNGDLHKIEDWFEFDTTGDAKLFNVEATLQNFTTTGGEKKLARYRWNWRKRAVTGSANDYASIFGLVDAINATQPEPFNSQIERLVNYEEWTRMMAIEHIVGNWDSYGYQRGKNMYAYKPQQGKWTLLPWDIDFVLGNDGDGPTTDLNPVSMTITDPTIKRFLSFPSVQRAWWRALQDAANGPLEPTRIATMMNGKYQGLIDAGIPVAAPAGPLAFVASRRSYIQSLLASVASPFSITTESISTNGNLITLKGTAPIEVGGIRINGTAFPVTWLDVSTWTATVALSGGANRLTVEGYDPAGNALPGASATVTITYTGVPESPKDHVVINEIMYNPALPDAAFVEFHNISTNAFDLSGYRVQGVDFTFPGGSVIAPGGFLVVAGNAAGFRSAYGPSIPLAGVFDGTLKNDDETLKLVKLGMTPAEDTVIDEVSYSSSLPWPVAANGFGPSLQLIDPRQDNNRVINWAAASTPPAPPAPRWQYVTATGTADNTKLYIYLNVTGDVYIDDMKLVAGNTPEVGANVIANGDFESELAGTWQTTANTAASSISSSVMHSGNSSLHLVCNRAGSTQGDSLWQNTSLSLNTQYTLSFWFLPKTNAGTLTVRLSGNRIRTDQNILFDGGTPIVVHDSTPGASNSVCATLPATPLLWLNEVQVNNLNGIRDNAGDREPWVELYNSGTSAIDLTGYYLSDTYSNLLRWPFPSGARIDPGQFKIVWLDNEPNETTGTNLHTNFRSQISNGSVVLTKVGAATNVIDYLNYGIVASDRSFGAFADGTASERRVFYYPTPGASNNNSWPAVAVLINEWMASNTRTLINPARTNYSDWFELYNAGPTAADLTGYYLANTINNPVQFKIPSGYTIPSGGFLLVWADSDSSENKPSDPSLHTSFKLRASGEAIALFTPDGALIDSVVFGQQTSDISQGRWPDGDAGQYHFMPLPTPGFANILEISTNHPPTLALIADQTAYQGTALSFTAIATDVDVGQTILYSLDPGAPASAYINSASGVFTWTPTQADPPGTYLITLRATDNAVPPKDVATSVSITVLAPPSPKIKTIVLHENGTVTFTWVLQPQKTYRVEYKSDLNDPSWTPLIETTATGTELPITDEVTSTQRFYRIVLRNP